VGTKIFVLGLDMIKHFEKFFGFGKEGDVQ